MKKLITLLSFFLYTTLSLGKTYWTPQTRDHALAWGRILEDENPRHISSRNIMVGPPEQKGRFKFREKITCDWVNHPATQKGKTPKFFCQKKGEKFAYKVKYGATNGEVFGEVIASRLFWALGFPADRNYPVVVECRGCPNDFEHPEKGSSTRVFDPAIIELRYPGETVETFEDEGWSYKELKLVEKAQGLPAVAKVDALKLLTSLIMHIDSKSANQKIICAQEAIRKDSYGRDYCQRPLLLVHDLGYTFGRIRLMGLRKTKVDLITWVREPVWKDRRQCETHLPRYITGTMWSPHISEEGRAYLAERLLRLTDRQIEELFYVAQVSKKIPRPFDAATWAREFKNKISDIIYHRCPFARDLD